jgi:hypothetical protein
MMADRQLPPGDRNDAPIPPPLPRPIELAAAARLELDAIGRALEQGREAYAKLVNALEEGELGAAGAAARRLVQELRVDPRALARRLAERLTGDAS